MTRIKVGDRVRDCDPRRPNRVLTVTKVNGGADVARVYIGHAWASLNGAGDRTDETRIRLDRIHDNQARRSGWVRIP